MKKKSRPCLVVCSVLKDEIEKLLHSGDVDSRVVWVSKYLNMDYKRLEKSLEKWLKKLLNVFTRISYFFMVIIV